jgi:hypothetical protein
MIRRTQQPRNEIPCYLSAGLTEHKNESGGTRGRENGKNKLAR